MVDLVASGDRASPAVHGDEDVGVVGAARAAGARRGLGCPAGAASVVEPSAGDVSPAEITGGEDPATSGAEGADSEMAHGSVIGCGGSRT